MKESDAEEVTLVDAHVHIHACSEWQNILDSAAVNFRYVAENSGVAGNFCGVLMLTEIEGVDCFRELSGKALNRGASGNDQAARWTLKATEEKNSLVAVSNGGFRIIMVAGRQIVTRERLEVLALGLEGHISDGHPIREVLDSVISAGGLAAIPWGFGKWWGRRGAVVADLIGNVGVPDFFLGDNGGRTAFLGTPRHFDMAKKINLRILPGSDPLPFPDDYGRAGSFGFRLDGAISDDYPARDLIQRLSDTNLDIHPYGSLEKTLRFVKNQIAMQLRKHERTAAGS